MEKIENVVFDLGGVVIGRDYDRYGAEIAEFSFLQGDRPFPEWWKRYDLGTASRSEVVEAVSAECGLGPEQAAAKLDRLMYLFNEFGDTAELIKELSAKGYGLEVFRYFDGQIVSSREGLAKPDPRMFGLLTERYGLRPERTLFVDDKPSNTSVAARLGFAVHTFVPGRESCLRIRELVGEGYER